MAIGATAYKLTVDATKFAEGTALSRKELAFLKATLKETATAADHYKAGIDQLTSLHEKGALDTDRYTRAMDRLNDEFKEQDALTASTAGRMGLTDRFLGMTAVIDPTRLAIDSLKVGWRGVKMVTNEVTEGISDQIEKIREAVEASDKLREGLELDDKLTEATKRLSEFGGTLTSLDISEFRKFEESAGRLQESLDTTWRTLTTEALPAMTGFSDALNDAFSDEKMQTGLRVIGDFAEDASIAFRELAPYVESVSDKLKGMVDAVPEWAQKLLTGGHTFEDVAAMHRTRDTLRQILEPVETGNRANAENRQRSIDAAAFMSSSPEFNPQPFSGFGGRDVSGYDLSRNEIGMRRLLSTRAAMTAREDEQRALAVERQMFGGGSSNPTGERSLHALQSIDRKLTEKIVVNEIKL